MSAGRGGQRGAGGEARVRWALAALLVFAFALRLWAASEALDNSYHFDERFSFRNVAQLLVEGTLEPANVFYPSLSYLPQVLVLAASEGFHRLTGLAALAIFDDAAADGWSATAYLLVRGVAGLFGVGSIWLTFRLGRRLCDRRAGLLAAALLAAFPAHIAASALFKPDILVTALVVATFTWALEAALLPGWRRYLLAGAGVGLAVAAKYTGVGVALAVAAGALAGGGWRRGRRWGLLLLAGAASLATFVVLNPFLLDVFAYLPRLWGIMESKGEAAGGSRLAVLAHMGRYLALHHGPVVSAFALVGLAGLARWALGGRASGSAQRCGAQMLLAYVVGYSLLYAAATALFKGQNYLPVAPFTSLAAAFAMVAAWDALAARWPWLGRRPVPALVWGLAIAGLFAGPVATVYLQVVPSTGERAERLLAARLQPARLAYAYYERGEKPLRPRGQGHRLIALAVDELAGVGEEELAHADALVFPARRLAGPDSAAYWRWLADRPAEARRLVPGFLTAHGPELVVLLTGWQPVAEPLTLAPPAAGDGHRLAAHLVPPATAGEAVSLSLWLPRFSGAWPKRVLLDGRELPLWNTLTSGRRAHFTTPRRALPAGTSQLQVVLPAELPLPFAPEVTLHRWRRGGERSGGEGPAGASGGVE